MRSAEANEIPVAELMREVRRYLTAVDVFRAEGREPSWLPEQAPAPKGGRRRQRLLLDAPPIP